MMDAYLEGYYAGLVYNTVCPHPFWSPYHYAWLAGNDVGVRVHCETVEAVVLHFGD